MFAHNITIVAPRDGTIGVYGGWTAGGGHNVLASVYGLGADQLLSMEVVTADGSIVTADEQQNQDLFYAMRGGGGSTYGILVSAVVRAYPPLEVHVSTFSFSGTSANTEDFWAAVHEYYWFQQHVCAAGGTAYDNLSVRGGRASFSAEIEMPSLPAAEIKALLQPMFDAFTTAGIPVTNPDPSPSRRWTLPTARDVRPGNTKFGSRLFPRALWATREAFERAMGPVRTAVEAGGYMFHGIHMWAARPDGVAENGVNPAFRTAQMHADLFDTTIPTSVSPDEWRAASQRFEMYMDGIRAATPGSGAYYNEADILEPNWQQSFFGAENYQRLLAIKEQRDPLGVFWAPRTVGSEGWEVRTDDYFPSQNGPLCRVE